MKFKKVKTTHTIIKDFYKFLTRIEQIEAIKRIIPGRISREQSGRAGLRVHFSYPTSSWLKYNLIKGSTAQELFIVVDKPDRDLVEQKISEIINQTIH